MIGNIPAVKNLAENDGLTLAGFESWFGKQTHFQGQIIQWGV
jgi:hypothetical protein